MRLCRREFLAATGALGFAGVASAATISAQPFQPIPRSRVLFVNDLGGDVDGLFAVAHALLSPSIDLRGIVATAAAGRDENVEEAMRLAKEVVDLTGRRSEVPIHGGASIRLKETGRPVVSPGSHAIIAEAMRSDRALPLYVAVGGGLTEVASALLIEPAIADRMTLIWIGGEAGSASWRSEYNFSLDPLAARLVFGTRQLPIWQVPRDVYAACLVSRSELEAYVAPQGDVGAWLFGKYTAAGERLRKMGMNGGETWTLGDSPLVLLTALTDWVPSAGGQAMRYENTGSSRFEITNRPRIGARDVVGDEAGSTIRLYRGVDTRLMLADFYAKLRSHASG